MANYVKWLLALAVVALLPGLTVPASAQDTSQPSDQVAQATSPPPAQTQAAAPEPAAPPGEAIQKAKTTQKVDKGCSMLFPYVTQAPGYDTGIAVANTTNDPQPVEFLYFGVFGFVGAQKSSPVALGQIMRYDLSTGSKEWGISPMRDFVGYVIAKTQWPSCYGFAYLAGKDETDAYVAHVLDTTPAIQPPLRE